MPTRPFPLAYRPWLRSRWANRSRALGRYSIAGSFVLLAFDLVFTRALAAPPPFLAILAPRLVWIALPTTGVAFAIARPDTRALPAAAVGLSKAWTWGNDWTYCALGLSGEPVQSLAVVLCVLAAAIFMPLLPPERLWMFSLMWLGHVGIDLTGCSARPLWLRMAADGAILALLACLAVLYEQFELEPKARDDAAPPTRTDGGRPREQPGETTQAAAEVTGMAAEVAHEVNSPLAAAKGNVQFLGEEPRPDEVSGERAEVAKETLQAVERIARIMDALRRQSTPEPLPRRAPPSASFVRAEGVALPCAALPLPKTAARRPESACEAQKVSSKAPRPAIDRSPWDGSDRGARAPKGGLAPPPGPPARASPTLRGAGPPAPAGP